MEQAKKIKSIFNGYGLYKYYLDWYFNFDQFFASLHDSNETLVRA